MPNDRDDRHSSETKFASSPLVPAQGLSAEPKRILFVDDEPFVLQAIESLLRRRRRVWQMEFVTRGEDAVKRLAEASFDVIVSDMRMPKMDGAALLEHVQSHHPNVIRIVLSGHTELETALRTVTTAHQYLTKPCDPEVLTGVIERACALRALLGNQAIRSVIGGIGGLPSVPKLYHAMTKALADPECSLSDVSAIVEQDVAMCAKLLQLVNSSFFGLAKRITKVHDAVVYLGASMLKQLVLSVSAFRLFSPPADLPGFSFDDLQKEAMLAASVARHIMGRKKGADDAYTAAMLHDIGTLTLATSATAIFRQALTVHREQGIELTGAEQQVFGATHAEIGAYLLGLWGLPYTVVEAVAYHHRPMAVDHSSFDVLDAVYVASALAEEAVLDPKRPGAYKLDTAYLGRFGVVESLASWQKLARERSEAPG
jgi:HD-like signal output (HDOD) protein/ActR/RegA family two-component response regulator